MSNKVPENIDLQKIYEKILSKDVDLEDDLEKAIAKVVHFSETQKGVLTVIITGLFYKYLYPEQDVRIHQSNLPGGYSGRTFDTKFVTPFMKNNQFPAMAESGWLTRSLEQAMPYIEGYKGSIKGDGLKEAFLKIYNDVENGIPTEDILSKLFQQLVIKRDASRITLSVPANLTIQQTLDLVKIHFESDYSYIPGAARLPSLAIFSAYKSMINNQIGRYNEKILCTLESHTAADSSTGSVGDIQINNNDGTPFEGLEIKAKPIEIEMMDTIYKKIQPYRHISRYYLLSTNDEISRDLQEMLNHKIAQIRSRHGCEVIVNGVFSTLKYFLRMNYTDDFLKFYTSSIEQDTTLKYEHKKTWNELCIKI